MESLYHHYEHHLKYATFLGAYLCHVEVTSTNATANIQNLLSWLQVQQIHKLL